MQKSDFKTIM